MSGITASEEFKAAFARLKSKEIRYFIASVEASNVKVEKEGERDSTFEEFRAAVPKDQPRFLLYDYEKDMDDGQHKSKMIFAIYCPDSIKIAVKIPYTSSVMAMQSAAPHTSHIQVGIWRAHSSPDQRLRRTHRTGLRREALSKLLINQLTPLLFLFTNSHF